MARIRDEQAQSLGYEDVLPGAGTGFNVPAVVKGIKDGESGAYNKPGPAPQQAPDGGAGGAPGMGAIYQLGGPQGGGALPGIQPEFDPSAQLLANLEQYRMALIQAIFAHMGGLG